MSEALGIDLRVAACAAARWRDGALEPCVLGEDGAAEVRTAELMAQAGGSPTHEVGAVEATRAALAAVAERALGGDTVEVVGVAYALTPDDGPRRLVEQAAVAAFGPAYLVPRPVAAVARSQHVQHGGGVAGGDIAVLDLDGNDVEIAVVRSGPDGYDVLGTSRLLAPESDHVDMAAHLNDAVTALEALLAASVGGNPGVRAVVAVGRSEWLDQLAVQVRVATGLEVSVDPEPAMAAAMGAALLAGGPDRRGRSRVAASAAVLGPAAVPLAQSLTTDAPVAGADVGAAMGDALAGSGEPGSGVGAALRDAVSEVDDDAVGDAVGEAVGDGLARTGASDGLRQLEEGRGDSGIGHAAGEAVGDRLADGAAGGLAGAAIGAGGRGRRAERRGGRRRRFAVGAGAAMAALVVVAGALAAFGGGTDRAGGTDDVETAGGERTATTRARSDRSPDRESDAPTTTVAGTPVTTGADGTPGDQPPAGAGPTTTAAGGGSPASPGSPAPSVGSTPSTTAGGGNPPATTASTTPADTSGPSVTALARSVGIITEDGEEFCEGPFTSVVSASISDASGVTSAMATWTGNGDTGTAAMTQSGPTWSATIGPVADNHNLDYLQTDTITWTVTAVDGAGNATSTPGPSITVRGC